MDEVCVCFVLKFLIVKVNLRGAYVRGGRVLRYCEVFWGSHKVCDDQSE